MPRDARDPTASLHQMYTHSLSNPQIAENAAVFQATVAEKLVRCLWFDPRLRPPELRTQTGQAVIVHHPGRWNMLAGPDFQQAVIEFGNGERRRGDVEIHRYASGWTAHRHHLDPRYNQVILHVLLWNDRQTTEIIRADGQAVPQVVLADWLPHPLTTYQADIVLEDYPYKHAPSPGRCYDALRQYEPEAVRQFLNRAGDVRLQGRMQRWNERAAEVGLGQTMYEAIMRALGSTGHRQHFQQLASRVTWQALQSCLKSTPPDERAAAAEALLLGLAGILDQVGAAVVTIDAETLYYVDRLQALWTSFPDDIRLRAWRDLSWRQPHVRPTNTPERRLAAMAQLLAQHADSDLLHATLAHCRAVIGQTDLAKARAWCKSLTALFELPLTSYWSRRSRFGSHAGKSQRLVGLQRARTVVVDAVLPVLLLYAQKHNDTSLRHLLLNGYHAAPRLPDNVLLRYMARRLLGHDPTLLSLITGARQQQGVLQIFYDHCDNDEGDCQGCDFPLFA
ncbi:MAG: DUF2851 family protein [bacterium]|nr:DUF2851 family protein [bacterium]